MDMFIEQYFEDYSIGYFRNASGWTVTEKWYCAAYRANRWLLSSSYGKEWCKAQPFKERIAYGTLTFSIAIGMTAGIINPAAITYGYEKLRFSNPVFIDDTICVKAEIVNKKQHVKHANLGIFSEKIEVFNQYKMLYDYRTSATSGTQKWLNLKVWLGAITVTINL